MTVSPSLALAPVADSRNEAGGLAYRLTPREALAQLAATGCFHNTFHASGVDQTAQVHQLAAKVEPEFLAKVAVYARERGMMKDAPALLLGILSGALTGAAKAEQAALRAESAEYAARYRGDVNRLSGLLRAAFPRVVDSPRMLRSYVGLVRGGSVGRRSLGSSPRRLVCGWLQARTPEQLFRASVGSDPSMGDLLALAHPVPRSREEAAMYGYLMGRERAHFEGAEFRVLDELPASVQAFEAFKKSPTGSLPRGVPYEMLEGLPLSAEQWVELALQSTWQQTRIHLSTFARKGVFASPEAVEKLAEKLANRELIKRARAMPYQLLVAYLRADAPAPIREALRQAAEIATENVPVIEGKIAVLVDVSGSMASPVTGLQKNARGETEQHTTAARCVDVAALVAAAVLRRNPEAMVLPFDHAARTSIKLDPRASILDNATYLASLAGGGTNCSAPLIAINQMGFYPDLVWYASDNESWLDLGHYGRYGGSRTETVNAWLTTREHNPSARMVCMDLSPCGTTQAPSDASVLNVGGFSDAVFEAVSAFCSGLAGSWVEMIENSFESLSANDTL